MDILEDSNEISYFLEYAERCKFANYIRYVRFNFPVMKFVYLVHLTKVSAWFLTFLVLLLNL